VKTKKGRKQNKTAIRNLPTAARGGNSHRWKYSALGIILLLAFISYLPVLNNGFVWDDEFYILNNPLIRTINLKEIFSQNVMGNYHPFTILTLATEFHFFGLSEAGYHAVNLLLHLLNIILVFHAIFLLSNKAVVALVASLLFGISPLHVESVAWAAELKDLLYTFFFLASYILYLKYLKNLQKKFYVFALLLFLLSLLSKAMAASLPVLLVLTDYFVGRKINIKTLLEKLPFFLLALIFGVVAVFAQKTSGFIQDLAVFPFPQRLVFACYGFITYLFKLLLPLHLSAYYPYPVKSGANIPIQYYAYILFFIGLAAYTFYLIRFSKKIIFGLGFFAITVFLVLQLLPVGGAIMADRYSYIPSIGIFYLAGEGFFWLWNKNLKLIAIVSLSALTVFFSAKTYSRCSVWKDEMTLWNNIISQYQTIPPVYVNRGNLLRDNNRPDEALKDYNKAIELNPRFAIAYFNRGTLFKNVKRNDEALKDFNKAIELDPSYAKAYCNRGIVFYNEKRYQEAIINYSKAIELKADFAESYFNRGLAEYYLGIKENACMDIKQARSLGFTVPANVLHEICK
jgi:tetratricopeptide (TPR) repeat protein